MDNIKERDLLDLIGYSSEMMSHSFLGTVFHGCTDPESELAVDLLMNLPAWHVRTGVLTISSDWRVR